MKQSLSHTKTPYFTKLNNLICLLLVLSISTIALSGCSALNKKANLTYTDNLFDTIIDVTILDRADEKIIEDIRDMCREFDTNFGKTRVGGDIYRINHANGKPTKVSDNTIDIIKEGIRYGDITGGLFDITIAPLSEIWNLKSEDFKVPSKEAISEAKSHVNYKNIKIDGNTVTLLDAKAGIDLGGIAKGYIADRIRDYLEKNNIKHALINLGGNVLVLGTKLDGSDYNIGIQKPFAKSGEAISAEKISDTSMVTSGIYERYKKVDGKIYHHIIDTRTGYPCENNLYSTTIIAKSSTIADIYSTTTFLMGYEKGKEFIEKQKDVRAVFITDDNEIHKIK